MSLRGGLFYGLADLELPFLSLFPLTLRVAVAAEHNEEEDGSGRCPAPI